MFNTTLMDGQGHFSISSLPYLGQWDKDIGKFETKMFGFLSLLMSDADKNIIFKISRQMGWVNNLTTQPP